MRSWSKFENINTPIPIVKYKLGNEVCYAIIDSGSEQTVFDATFVKEHADLFKLRKEYNSRMSLSGVSPTGADIACHFARATLGFRKPFEIEVEGLLMSLDHLSEHFNKDGIKLSVLIGADVLAKHNARIDFDKQKLVFL